LSRLRTRDQVLADPRMLSVAGGLTLQGLDRP
jgi:hypothetical protein